MKPQKLTEIALLLPGLGFLVVLFAGPLLWSMAGSLGLDGGLGKFTLDHYLQVFVRPSLRYGLMVSIYYGIVPVLSSLLLAVPLALLLRRHFPGRVWFNGLYKLPMAIPGIIAALMLMTLAERGGFVDRLIAPLGLSLPALVRDSWGIGVIITLVWKQLPFMTLVIAGAFAAIPQDLTSVARSLGANRWNTLIWVELPLALPGISAAVLLTFIGSVGAFAIPDLVGPALPKPLSVHLVAEFGSGNLPLVYAIGMLLAAFAAAVLIGYYALSNRAMHLVAGKSPAGQHE
jgi:putative spermidine/putrescine transport system permease protein